MTVNPTIHNIGDLIVYKDNLGALVTGPKIRFGIIIKIRMGFGTRPRPGAARKSSVVYVVHWFDTDNELEYSEEDISWYKQRVKDYYLRYKKTS